VTRDATERGVELPPLTDLNAQQLEELVPSSVSAKTKHLLQWLGRKAKFPGDSTTITLSNDYPLVYGRNDDELWFFLTHLQEAGLIDRQGGSICTVTAEGWSEIEASRLADPSNPKAFVAMWFSDKLIGVFENGIKPAIETTGFQAVRVDALQHNDKIDDRIIAEIRESRFLVADFTGHRGGVYFEAGYAMGLGLPVIWLCREDDIGDAHFDTRQYNHIVWKESDDLREKLSLRIRATVGTGPLARPSK